MTVAAANTETTYLLAGVNLGPLASVWVCEDLTQVAVYLDTGAGAVLLGGMLYTVAGAFPATAGLTVTLSAANLVAGAWPANSKVTLQRRTPATQPSALGTAVGFDPSLYEAALDHLERQIQELITAFTRALRAPPGDYPLTIPSALARGNQYLGFDALGNPLATFGAASTGAASVTRVVLATPAAVGLLDEVLSMQVAGAPAALAIPDPTASFQRRLTIVDGAGTGAAYPITITPVAGTIDGVPSWRLSTPRASITLVSDGTQWLIVAQN